MADDFTTDSSKDFPSRALGWTLIIALLLLLGTFAANRIILGMAADLRADIMEQVCEEIDAVPTASFEFCVLSDGTVVDPSVLKDSDG